MRYFLPIIFSFILISGCGSSSGTPVENTVDKAPVSRASVSVDLATAVKIQKNIPFKKGAPITANVKNECSLGTKLSEFIESYSLVKKIDIVRLDEVSKSTNGQALVVSITGAVSSGNAFIGHRKYTKIDGTLFENGKRKAGFTAGRVSGGGAFGGFKGSCSVLGRTVKTLGRDVSSWLEDPVDGEHLGDGV